MFTCAGRWLGLTGAGLIFSVDICCDSVCAGSLVLGPGPGAVLDHKLD